MIGVIFCKCETSARVPDIRCRVRTPSGQIIERPVRRVRRGYRAEIYPTEMGTYTYRWEGEGFGSEGTVEV